VSTPLTPLIAVVEHAAGPGRGAAPRPSALAGVEYEGFERDDHTADEVSPLVRAVSSHAIRS
jgi:hypothetical protein